MPAWPHVNQCQKVTMKEKEIWVEKAVFQQVQLLFVTKRFGIYVLSSYAWYNLQIYNTCWTSQNEKTPTETVNCCCIEWSLTIYCHNTCRIKAAWHRCWGKFPDTRCLRGLSRALWCSWSMEERLLIADIDPPVAIAVKTLFKLIMLMTEGWDTS